MTLRKTVLAGSAIFLLAAGGTALATGKLKTMTVDLNNGTVAEIEYAGDVAPTVKVVPVGPLLAAAPDPVTDMDRVFAEMEARRAQMMQQVAEMQRQAAAAGAQAGQAPGQMVVTTSMPSGSTYNYTVVSTTSANGRSCTQTVHYSSDGKAAEPKVTKATSGDCDAVKTSEEAIPASAPAQKQPSPQPRDPNMI